MVVFVLERMGGRWSQVKEDLACALGIVFSICGHWLIEYDLIE